MLYRQLFLFSFLLLASACSQDPAAVELNGQNSYGRSYYASLLGPSSSPAGTLYSYAAPSTYTTTAGNVTQNAGVQHVGVTDLAAMTPTAGEPTFNTPVTSTPTATSVASLSSSRPSPVNPWTRQPHFTAAENASEAAPPKPASVKAENLSFIWPVDSRHVISGFGPKSGGKANDGINIAAAEGEPVWAAADGEVVYVGNELAGYGTMVLIHHAGDKTTAYAHLGRANVDKYDHVKQGDIIGYVGSTGSVREPQLHFAIRQGTQPIDPEKYLSESVAGL